jgi:hypothetical protein
VRITLRATGSKPTGKFVSLLLLPFFIFFKKTVLINKVFYGKRTKSGHPAENHRCPRLTRVGAHPAGMCICPASKAS